MKASAIHDPKPYPINLWDILGSLFKISASEEVHPEEESNPDPWSGLKFFRDEDDLEDYLQSFRE